MFKMAKSIFGSLNVQGINHPGKRTKILYHLHKLKTYVLFLQESHFKLSDAPSISSKYFHNWVTSDSRFSKMKGVANEFHRKGRTLDNVDG